MYLGICLHKLGDFDNSVSAFKKAIDLDPNDCTVHLNFAIILFNNGRTERARSTFKEAEKIFETLEEDEKEPEMMDQRTMLMEMLGI
jgi:Flp pilus assembly protein TadD